MRHDARAADVRGVRADVGTLRDAVKAAADVERAAAKDRADFERIWQEAQQRARSFDPRNPQHVAMYAQDKAGLEVWEAYLRGLPAKRERAQGAVTQSIRALAGRLATVADYFEAPFLAEEVLLPGGAEAAIATAESILSRRLPAHAPVISNAQPISGEWLAQTYRLLLEGATREPAQPIA